MYEENMDGMIEKYYAQSQQQIGMDPHPGSIGVPQLSVEAEFAGYTANPQTMESSDTGTYYTEQMLQDQGHYANTESYREQYQRRANPLHRDNGAALRATSNAFLTAQPDIPAQGIEYNLSGTAYPSEINYPMDLSDLNPSQAMSIGSHFTPNTSAFPPSAATTTMGPPPQDLSLYQRASSHTFSQPSDSLYSTLSSPNASFGPHSSAFQQVSPSPSEPLHQSHRQVIPTSHTSQRTNPAGNSMLPPTSHRNNQKDRAATATKAGLVQKSQNSRDLRNISSVRLHGQQSTNPHEQSHSPTDTQALANTSVVPAKVNFEGIYSTSGFDMMSILTMVATRPNPRINIGPVDMSCSFVVCDATRFDMPIIYCSDMFERLTGYSKHEIIGRNCRFLQSPDGRVQPGIPRKYVDDEVIWDLKKAISKKGEAQIGLINYRKGGQPFMNMLTTIPIFAEGDKVRWYVGLQIDLVEHPGSIESKKSDGTISVNYQRALLPNYRVPTRVENERPTDQGLTIGRDDVSTVLSTVGSGDSELSKRLWDKILLENTDDVVQVLSLRGLFLYLSPSSRKVLEYQPNELIGTSISSICHPSDIVPVTRDLKDTTNDSSISIIHRIRRKHSGYTWFESHGCLHTEQGKGRKCIILVGRERPVYTLRRKELDADGGVGDNELWSKLSTSGMFLFTSSYSRTLLDYPPEELIGTSMQALMRHESGQELGKALEKVRSGHRTTLKHEMQHRQSSILQVETTLFPGDATVGQKPTFIVARTRFLRAQRGKHVLAAKRRVSGKSPPTPGATPSEETKPSTPIEGQLPHHVDRMETVNGSGALAIGNQDVALASEENLFEELKTTRSTSWQFELRQMQRTNKRLSEDLQTLMAARKKRKRRKGAMDQEKDCANCHTRITSEWRRGPSGKRDLCNSCGLRYAKSIGRTGSGKSSQQGGSSLVSPLPLIPDSTRQSSLNTGSRTEQMPSTPSKTQPSPPKFALLQAAESRSSYGSPLDKPEQLHFKPPSLLSGLSPESALEPP